MKIKEKKQGEALKDLNLKDRPKSAEAIFPEGYESAEIKREINNIKEYEKKSIEGYIIYYSSKEPFGFRAF